MELRVLAAAPPPGAGACGRWRSRAPRCAGCAGAAAASWPAARMCARCSSRRSTSSSTPSPLVASVLTIGTRQLSRTSCAGAVEVGERQHAADLAHHRVGQGMVGLVDHDHVGDLHHPGLQRLDRVARAGHQHQHDRVGVVDDVDLRLPDADGLHEHVLAPGGVEQQRGLQRRLGEAAERAAVGHRADEHARVEEVLGEADAVAEQRAVGERRGGVDRQHADVRPASRRALVSAPISVDLPTPGGPVKPTTAAVAGVRVDLADELPALGAIVLDERDRARQRAAVAVEQALGERRARSSSGNHRRAVSAGAPQALRFAGDGAAARRRRDAAARRAARRRRARARPRRCTADRSRWLRFMRANSMLSRRYARLLAPLCCC